MSSSTGVCVSYMSEEAVRHSERVFPAGLQLSQEELTVEVQKFLQVPEDDGALPPQVLREVGPVHLWEVVMDDVPQRADVLPLCGHHLLHDVPQLTAHITDIYLMPLCFSQQKLKSHL